MIYKIVCIWCVAALACAAPSSSASDKEPATVIPIVAQTDELEPNGTYKYSYETGNGIKREEISYDKTLPAAEGRSAGGDKSKEGEDDDESNEIHVQKGSWSYVAPDGTEIKVSYIADENGFQPIGDHLPRVPGATGPSTGSEEKSGRSLKHADQSEAGSAPAVESVKPSEASSDASKETTPVSEGASTTAAPSSSEADGTTKTADASTTSAPASTTSADASAASADASTTPADASTTSAPASTTTADASTTLADASTTPAGASNIQADSSTTLGESSSTPASSSTAEGSSTTPVAV